MRKTLKGIMLVLSMYFSIILFIDCEAYASEKVKILFISSYNISHSTFIDQIEGIKAGFNRNVEIQFEYLDSGRITLESAEERFYNLLKDKLDVYEAFDGIILADNEALRFGSKYREDLFKDIPIVFLGVSSEEDINDALKYDLFSGVKEENSIGENIKLIRELHKNVNNITIINNEIDDELEKTYNEAIEKYPDMNFRMLITKDMSFEKYKNELLELDKDDAVVMLYPYEFKDNKVLTAEESIELTSRYISAPIYSVVSYGVGDGFLGGKVVSHFEQGKSAAKILQGMMDNKDPLSLYIGDDSANKYIFDYYELKKFNISKLDLPKGSVILNEPPHIRERFKGIIFPTVIVVTSLILIILVLTIYSIKLTKHEKELIKAKNEAEEANRAKSNFISNINHELRTPVTVIMAANKLFRLKLSESGVSSLTRRMDAIDQNCYRLLRLINNIIDVAKIDSGFNELRLKNMNIIEKLEEVSLSVIPYAEEKSIDIIFDTNAEEFIMAIDPDKIERIVLNLLSNAIKFSKENGEVFINVTVENDKVIFTVQDTGIGISEEDLKRIFNKFAQVDNTFTRENEGSGIGLSLVKSFVEMHKGQVKVDSKLGMGTRFTVELPINIIEENIYEGEIIEDDATIIRTKVEFSDIYL